VFICTYVPSFEVPQIARRSLTALLVLCRAPARLFASLQSFPVTRMLSASKHSSGDRDVSLTHPRAALRIRAVLLGVAPPRDAGFSHIEIPIE
jgi:hypothetical protein